MFDKVFRIKKLNSLFFRCLRFLFKILIVNKLDLHTFLGLKQDHAGYNNITVKVHIDCDASPEELQTLHDTVSNSSPVGHTLGRAIPLKFELG